MEEKKETVETEDTAKEERKDVPLETSDREDAPCVEPPAPAGGEDAEAQSASSDQDESASEGECAAEPETESEGDAIRIPTDERRRRSVKLPLCSDDPVQEPVLLDPGNDSETGPLPFVKGSYRTAMEAIAADRRERSIQLMRSEIDDESESELIEAIKEILDAIDTEERTIKHPIVTDEFSSFPFPETDETEGSDDAPDCVTMESEQPPIDPSPDAASDETGSETDGFDRAEILEACIMEILRRMNASEQKSEEERPATDERESALLSDLETLLTAPPATDETAKAEQTAETAEGEVSTLLDNITTYLAAASEEKKESPTETGETEGTEGTDETNDESSEDEEGEGATSDAPSGDPTPASPSSEERLSGFEWLLRERRKREALAARRRGDAQKPSEVKFSGYPPMKCVGKADPAITSPEDFRLDEEMDERSRLLSVLETYAFDAPTEKRFDEETLDEETKELYRSTETIALPLTPPIKRLLQLGAKTCENPAIVCGRFYTDGDKIFALRNQKAASLCRWSKQLTAIEPMAFFRLPLSKVHVPSSIRQIGYGAFAYCGQLSVLTFAEGVETIGAAAFARTPIQKVTLPASVKTIEELAFGYCEALTEVVISEGTETIGNRAFCGCKNLQRIFLPVSLHSIGDLAFYGAKHAKLYFYGSTEEWLSLTDGKKDLI